MGFKKGNWDQGKYELVNPSKYISKRLPNYKSSWEQQFMWLMDHHPYVLQWGYEAVPIPYKHPFKNKSEPSIYYPDFFVSFINNKSATRHELIELKPLKLTSPDYAKTKQDKLTAAVNQVKFMSCVEWCKKNDVFFRLMTEKQLYEAVGKGMKKR